VPTSSAKGNTTLVIKNEGIKDNHYDNTKESIKNLESPKNKNVGKIAEDFVNNFKLKQDSIQRQQNINNFQKNQKSKIVDQIQIQNKRENIENDSNDYS